MPGKGLGSKLAVVILFGLISGCGSGGGSSSNNNNNDDDGSFIIETGITIQDKTIPQYSNGDSWDYTIVDGKFENSTTTADVSGSVGVDYFTDSKSTTSYGDLDERKTSFSLTYSNSSGSTDQNANSTVYQQQDPNDNSIDEYGNASNGFYDFAPVDIHPGTIDLTFAKSLSLQFGDGTILDLSITAEEKQLVEVQGAQYETFKINSSSTINNNDGSRDEISTTFWYSPKLGAVVKEEYQNTSYDDSDTMTSDLQFTYEITDYSVANL